jgi:hypothetical protein
VIAAVQIYATQMLMKCMLVVNAVAHVCSAWRVHNDICLYTSVFMKADSVFVLLILCCMLRALCVLVTLM